MCSKAPPSSIRLGFALSLILASLHASAGAPSPLLQDRRRTLSEDYRAISPRIGPPSERSQDDAAKKENIIFEKNIFCLSNKKDLDVRRNQEVTNEGGDLTLEEMREILCKERELLRQVRRSLLCYQIKCY